MIRVLLADDQRLAGVRVVILTTFEPDEYAFRAKTRRATQRRGRPTGQSRRTGTTGPVGRRNSRRSRLASTRRPGHAGTPGPGSG
jgi:hypothetical protein